MHMITISNTNLGVKCRLKADIILKSKNAVIILHSIVMEFMNKAFRFKKNESTYDILYPNWYKAITQYKNQLNEL